VRSGTTRVEVRTVAPPLEAYRPAATVASTTPVVAAGAVTTERMFMQIGAFSDLENAERLVARLHASGFSNSSVVGDPSQRRLHRVWLGPVRDSVEFDAIDARLRAIGVAGARLVVDRAP
jgi:cell division protein FtsN